MRAAVLWAAVLLAALVPRAAEAQLNLYSTLEVDTTAVSLNWFDGVCSLREAILNVNSHGQGGALAGECEAADGRIGSTIVFDPAVFGGGAVIALDSRWGPLPAITADYTTVDGWSAGGAGYTGPPLVTLDGSGLADSATKVQGLLIKSSSNTVRGLAVVSFSTPSIDGSVGIEVFGDDNRLFGNFIGVAATGATAAGNYGGIRIAGSGNLVGTNGDGVNDLDERNVVGANEYGIAVFLDDNVVAGNFVGTDASGLGALGNTTGIVAADRVMIGGESAAERNLVAGNRGTGILYTFRSGLESFVVRGNYLGTDRTGLAALPNTSGITVKSDLGAVPGPRYPAPEVLGNVIAGNTEAGLVVQSSCAPLPCRAITGALVVRDNLVGLGTDGITVVGNGVGIRLVDSPDNVMTGNIVSGNTAYGIRIEGAESSGNTIRRNIIGLDGEYQPVYQQSVGLDLAQAPGNTIVSNTLSGSATQLEIVGVGSSLEQNLVSNNRFGTDPYGRAVGWFDVGVAVTDSADTRLEHNLFRSCTRAIELSGTAEVVLRDNLLTDNSAGTDAALQLKDTATVLYGTAGNCFESNIRGVLNLTGSNAVLESNWWGDASGPSGAGSGSGDSVSADVDFDPWLTTRPDCGVILLFVADFEGGDTRYWTTSVP